MGAKQSDAQAVIRHHLIFDLARMPEMAAAGRASHPGLQAVQKMPTIHGSWSSYVEYWLE